MTVQERQVLAVRAAVKEAILELGLSAIKQAEFFGLKQEAGPDVLKKAA